MLIDGLNRCSGCPWWRRRAAALGEAAPSSPSSGHDVIAHYRAIERAATKAGAASLTALDAQSGPRAAAAAPAGFVASASRRRSSSMPRRARG